MFLIKKFIIFAVLFSFVFPCFCVTSSAEDLSWKDYIKEVDVEAGTVTVSLPATPSTFVVSPSGLQDQIFPYVDYMLYTFESYEETGREYSLQISPNPADHLFLGNVPDGTEINIYLDIRSVSYPDGNTVNGLPTIPVWNFTVDRYNANLFYYDEAGEILRVESMDFDEYYWAGDDPEELSTISTFWVIHDLNDPLGNFDSDEYFQSAHSMRTTYFFEGMRFSTTEEVKISISSFEILFYMDSLISSDGEYSEILEVILASLARYGKTVDLMTGDIIPIAPDQQVAIDSVADYETDLNHIADQGLLMGGQLFTDGLAFISSISPCILACSTLIDKFIDISPFRNLLVVSISLGSFALLLNLGIYILKSHSKSKGRD